MPLGDIGKDCTFELDTFGKPRLCSEAESLRNVVMFILFSKPGCYPSLPNIGMNIRQLLYSYYDEINEQELESRLVDQCAALSTYFQEGALAIRKMMYRNMPSLLLYIQIDQTDNLAAVSKSGKVSNGYYIGLSVTELKELLVNISPSYTV